jgi:hypothetical protein
MIVIMCLGNYLLFFAPSLIRRSHEKPKNPTTPIQVRSGQGHFSNAASLRGVRNH